MPISPATRDKIETFRDAFAAIIVPKQNAYFATHGRYWQGVIMPTTLPVEGADTDPDGSVKPTDQAESWADFFGVDLPAKFPCRLRIDAYNGPEGQGYTVTALVSSNSNTWCRIWNVGPQSWRARTWHQLTTMS